MRFKLKEKLWGKALTISLKGCWHPPLVNSAQIAAIFIHFLSNLICHFLFISILMKQDSDPELLWLNWANQSLGLRPTEHVFQTKQQKSTLKKQSWMHPRPGRASHKLTNCWCPCIEDFIIYCIGFATNPIQTCCSKTGGTSRFRCKIPTGKLPSQRGYLFLMTCVRLGAYMCQSLFLRSNMTMTG